MNNSREQAAAFEPKWTCEDRTRATRSRWTLAESTHFLIYTHRSRNVKVVCCHSFIWHLFLNLKNRSELNLFFRIHFLNCNMFVNLMFLKMIKFLCDTVIS